MIKSLTSLKFLLSVAIFLHHLNYPGGLGPICVTFFFVMSGFTIANGYHSKFSDIDIKSLKSFYFRRIFKIYPLYLLTLICSIPIMWYINFKTGVIYSVLNVLMLQSYFPIGIQVFAFNGSSWFVADIVLFYLLTPFVIHLIHKYKIKENLKILFILQAVIFVLAVMIASDFTGKVEAYSFGWWFIYISPFFRVFDYLIGVLAGFIFVILNRKVVLKLQNTILFTILEIGMVALLMFSPSLDYFKSDALRYGVYFIPMSIAIICVFSFEKGAVSIGISNKAFVYLGNLSYQIFLIHQIVIGYTAVVFESPIHGYSANAKHLLSQMLLFFAIVCISDVIHRYYEEPLLRIKDKCGINLPALRLPKQL